MAELEPTGGYYEVGTTASDRRMLLFVDNSFILDERGGEISVYTCQEDLQPVLHEWVENTVDALGEAETMHGDMTSGRIG